MANILVIDDDVLLTEALQAHFSKQGHMVTVAHRGDEGMTAAEKTLPDVILLDVILPDMTGFQMCSRLRKNPTTEATPILMITGVARYPNQEQFGRERGANEYILKPFDLVQLAETLEKYLNPTSESAKPTPKKVITPMPRVNQTPHSELGRLRAFLRNAIKPSKLTS